MQIYVHRNNEQIGPFTEEEIKAQLASGALSLQDHVWWQGQANWMPLGQTPLVAAAVPAISGYVHNVPVPTNDRTSGLAIASLVCGCLSLVCSILTAIPAIILGHMGLSEIKKNPGMQGRGMALAGVILGYIFTALLIIYIVSISVLIALGNQVKSTFKTIDAQVQAAQAQRSQENSDTNQTTNSPDQSTNSAPPANNSSNTNSAPTPVVTP